ncbi:Tkl/drk protein kinase, partial [Globisporangium splendens]
MSTAAAHAALDPRDRVACDLREYKLHATRLEPRGVWRGRLHPIVQLLLVTWDSIAKVCVVTEVMHAGDLRTLLTSFDTNEKPRSKVFHSKKRKIACHVTEALVHLHTRQPRVLHRDLRSKYILLTNTWIAKLTNIGCSQTRTDCSVTSGAGSSLWMAREVVLGKQCTEKADIFAFGVMLSKLDSHALPCAHVEDHFRVPDAELLCRVVEGKLQVTFSADAPPGIAQLGRECEALDPSDRPIAAHVLTRLQPSVASHDAHM